MSNENSEPYVYWSKNLANALIAPVTTTYETKPCWKCTKCNSKYQSKPDICKHFLRIDINYTTIKDTFENEFNIKLNNEQIDNIDKYSKVPTSLSQFNEELIEYYLDRDETFLDMGSWYHEDNFLDVLEMYLQERYSLLRVFRENIYCKNTKFNETTWEKSHISSGVTLSIGGTVIDRF